MSQSHLGEPVVAQGDPLRWVTFSAFWGFIYYLLSFIGLVAAHKHTDVQINRRSAGLALCIHELVFITIGTLGSYAQQRFVGRSAKQQTEDAITDGQINRSIPLQAIGGTVGACIPFGMTLGAMATVTYVTGEPVFKPAVTNWRLALLVTSGLSGLVGLAVSRIVGWVVLDTRQALQKQ